MAKPPARVRREHELRKQVLAQVDHLGDERTTVLLLADIIERLEHIEHLLARDPDA